jgi:hypothetical protein
MSATETRLPVSKATRQEIRVVKARAGFETYDETLAALADAYEPEDTN